MTAPPKRLRCAIYARKSTEEGLDMEFNSLDAQREACEAYVQARRPRAGPPSASATKTGAIPAEHSTAPP